MKIIFFLILLSGHLYLFCQKSKTEIINPEHLSFRELRLTAQRIAPADIKLPFASVKIIDARFDTSKLGFIPSYFNLVPDKRTIFRKIRFKDSKSIAKPIEEYYNEYYKNSFTPGGLELLIVMKRFWVSGIDYSRSKNIELTYNLNTDTYLYCKWEYYIGNGNEYMPVKRVDTILTVNDNMAQFIEEEFDEKRLGRFKYVLKGLIEIHDFNNAVSVYSTRQKKTISEITTYNNKRNDLQILKDSFITKGVYFSFDEFKNNKPSFSEYKEKRTRYGLLKEEKYLTDVNDILINTYWGYSDGEDFRYGKYGNDKLFHIGNTFQFFVQVIIINADNSTPVTTKQKFKAWVPYQIDMETGEIY